MDFYPDFQIGIYNTYIASIVLVITPRVMAKLIGGNFEKIFVIPPMNNSEKIIYYGCILVFIFSLLLTIFIPFVYNTPIFWLGLFVSCIGLFISLCAIYIFTTAPKHKLIETGIYKISRNPEYFGSVIYLVGVALMANSIFFLLLSFLFFLLYQIMVQYEERMCEEMYGDKFIEYKNSTPKNFIFF